MRSWCSTHSAQQKDLVNDVRLKNTFTFTSSPTSCKTACNKSCGTGDISSRMRVYRRFDTILLMMKRWELINLVRVWDCIELTQYHQTKNSIYCMVYRENFTCLMYSQCGFDSLSFHLRVFMWLPYRTVFQLWYYVVEFIPQLIHILILFFVG